MAISRKPQQVKASEEQIQSIINQGGSVAKNSKSETIVSDKKKSLQLRLDAELINLIDESHKKTGYPNAKTYVVTRSYSR